MNAPSAQALATNAIRSGRHHRHLSWRIRDAVLSHQPHVYFSGAWIPLRKCQRVLYWMLRRPA